MVILHIFPPFWYFVPRKIWQPCFRPDVHAAAHEETRDHGRAGPGLPPHRDTEHPRGLDVVKDIFFGLHRATGPSGQLGI
jgi:hypothetical protein